MTIGTEYILTVMGALMTFVIAYFWYDRTNVQKRIDTTEQNFNLAFDRFTKSLQNLQVKIQSIQQELAANRALSMATQRPSRDCQAYIHQSVIASRQELRKEIKYAVIDGLQEYALK